MKKIVLLFAALFSLTVKAEGMAPNFDLPNIFTDEMHSLQDYRGKVIYLDFWASWCGPCRQSLPALSRFQEELNNDDFEVIAINVDAEREDGLNFLSQFPVNYTVLTDGSGGTSRKYDLVGLPTSVLISKDGEIVRSFEGFHPEHLKKLKKAIHILTE